MKYGNKLLPHAVIVYFHAFWLSLPFIDYTLHAKYRKILIRLLWLFASKHDKVHFDTNKKSIEYSSIY